MPTYPLDMPTTPVMDGANMQLTTSTSVFTSPWTGTSQRSEASYSLWVIGGSYPIMEPAEARPWRSFFTQLHGQAGNFKMLVPGYPGTSSGYSGPAGLVKGAAQTGLSIITDGWTPGLVLNEGDYFTVNNELKVVIADVTADGLGEATITFEPALHFAPADNAPLTIDAPYAIMALTSDEPGWQLSTPYLHSFALQAIEVISN